MSPPSPASILLLPSPTVGALLAHVSVTWAQQTGPGVRLGENDAVGHQRQHPL